MKQLIRLSLIIVAAALVMALADIQTIWSQTAKSIGARNRPTPTASQPANTEDESGCEWQALPDVLAIIDGVRISRVEVEQSIAKQVDELKQKVIAARARELSLQINSKLLAAEARRLGTNQTGLINTEIIAKVAEPTEAEAQTFYDQNKARIRADFKDVKTNIIDHLRNERQGEAARKFADRLRTEANIAVPPRLTPPKTPADRNRVLVTVKGENITAGNIEDALRAGIFDVQQQIYNLRKQTLDLKINDLLLEQEALRRKMTTTALLQVEVAAKTRKVTDADLRAFYDLHKEELKADFVKLRDQILNYLQQQEERTAQTTFALQLRRASSLEVFLIEPEAPVYQIATDDQPSRGPESSQVTIVEFTDFQCPSCAKTQPELEKLIKEYEGRVRLVVRDFPLEQHAEAFKAAEAAEAAREQGKYWEYTAILMDNQNALGVDKLKEYAGKLGIDRQKFDAALDSGKFADRVQRDLRDGVSYGVDSTPALFINGRRSTDNSYDSLKAAIEVALKDAVKK